MRPRRRRKGYRAIARDLDATYHKVDLIAKHAARRYPADRRLNELVSKALEEIDNAATAVLWLGNR